MTPGGRACPQFPETLAHHTDGDRSKATRLPRSLQPVSLTPGRPRPRRHGVARAAGSYDDPEEEADMRRVKLRVTGMKCSERRRGRRLRSPPSHHYRTAHTSSSTLGSLRFGPVIPPSPQKLEINLHSLADDALLRLLQTSVAGSRPVGQDLIVHPPNQVYPRHRVRDHPHRRQDRQGANLGHLLQLLFCPLNVCSIALPTSFMDRTARCLWDSV